MDRQTVATLVVAATFILASGLWFGWKWFKTQTRLFLKAAEYAGYTQNDFEMFGRGREPSPEELIRAIRDQPKRLGQRARFLAEQIRKFHESDVELFDKAEERLTNFCQAFEGDYLRRIHHLQAWEPADLAAKFSGYAWSTPELQVALLNWRNDVLTWMQVVERTLNHWKSRHKQHLATSRG